MQKTETVFPGIETDDLNGNNQDHFNVMDGDVNRGGNFSNRAGNTIFDDMDEFVENGNGNLMFDDDVMGDDNCFLSPANQDFLNPN